MSPLNDEEWQRIFRSLNVATTGQRTLMNELVASGALERVREVTRGLEQAGGLAAVRNATRAFEQAGVFAGSELVADRIRQATSGLDALAATSATREAWLRRWQERMAPLHRALEGFDATRWSQLSTAIENVSATAVLDPQVGLDEAVASAIPGTELSPDGIAALPFIIENLTPGRKRDVALRLVALVIATWLYVDALANDQRAGALLVNAVLMNFWLYASVLAAIEEVKDDLLDEG